MEQIEIFQIVHFVTWNIRRLFRRLSTYFCLKRNNQIIDFCMVTPKVYFRESWFPLWVLCRQSEKISVRFNLCRYLRVPIRTTPDIESQDIKSMCPWMPSHNFLLSVAQWPTEKHIRNLGPTFSLFLRNSTFYVLTLSKFQYGKC